MESLAVFRDEDSFNRMFSYEEGQLNFMQQIFHQFSFSPMHDEWSSLVNPSTFCPNPEANMGVAGVNESLFCSSNALDSNFHYQSQESSWSSNSSSSVFVPQLNYETDFLGDSNHIAVTNGITMSLDISTDIDGVNDKITDSFPPAFTNIAMGDAVNVIEDLSTDNANELLLKRKFDVLELHDEGYKINTESSQTTKKRARLPKDSNKNRKNNVNGNEESNIGGDGQSSSTSSSDDDNVSQALNLNGKRRTSRGKEEKGLMRD
ncbi:Adenine phosphoribosyl transferase 1 isoform 1 [Hibiscus syriacus]|uniref:Adenine phosphoribosyl transferase 1 isoform 1 n=2 Tax=Hibiscus syriacus TaxID=106335 RepID=A0A6A2YTT9_HIBSY|nr:Adenine phosphoribosyl transferase 1 isoform 1 [Hibiscus syriacus]